MKTISLITCNNSQEASLIKGNLENEGIPCFLTNEHIVSVMPNYNGIMGLGVQVMIYENDFERASQLIQHASDVKLRCPFCDSENIRYGLGKSRTGKVLVIILSLLAWTPFGNVGTNYYCQDCKTDFKK